MIAPTQPYIVSCPGIGKHGEYRREARGEGTYLRIYFILIITTNVSVSAADIIRCEASQLVGVSVRPSVRVSYTIF